MAPILDGTASSYGEYAPGFLDTAPTFFFRIAGARWPYWLALAALLMGGRA